MDRKSTPEQATEQTLRHQPSGEATTGFKLREKLRLTGELIPPGSRTELFGPGETPPAVFVDMLEVTPTFPGLNGESNGPDLRIIVADAGNAMMKAVNASPDMADDPNGELARKLGAPTPEPPESPTSQK